MGKPGILQALGSIGCIGLNILGGVLIALAFSYSYSSTIPLNWSTRSLSFKVNRNEAEYCVQLMTQTLSYITRAQFVLFTSLMSIDCVDFNSANTKTHTIK